MVVRKCFLSLLVLLMIGGMVQAQPYGFCENYDERYPRTSGGNTYYWHPELWNFYDLKQRRVSGLSIGDNMFNGLLEYLPPGYDPNDEETRYPVIIYFHGGASMGNGTEQQLCRLFKDRGGDSLTHLSIPGRVERFNHLFTQTVGGKEYKFIVISPQFNIYQRLHPTLPDRFPSFNEVDAVIDYVEANYNIDPRAIFLTGFSNGANMITEYVGKSVANASRVAAVMPIALCSELYHSNNTDRGISASYIAQAQLKTWFVYCERDNCGPAGYDPDVSQEWVDAIKAIPGNMTPRYTLLTDVNPPTLYRCSDTLWHDAWSRAYNPDFKASFVNGNGTNDGINLNMYEWFASIANDVILPVTLKSFTARLVNARVELQWITTDEKNNASFTIERAGEDQQFTTLHTLPGAGDHLGEKTYTYTDGSPLEGLSYYRLVQTDFDGKKTYFEIKRIVNRQGLASGAVVSPNPFRSELTAFISVSRPQKVSVMLTDLAGKQLRSVNGWYGEGSTEIKLRSQDLPKGLYFLKVLGEDFSSTQKVIKQ